MKILMLQLRPDVAKEINILKKEMQKDYAIKGI